MTERTEYKIHLDPAFDFLQKIDVPKFVDGVTEKWFNQTLCRVNDSVVRLGVLQGEFHWHKHDKEDEFFFVLDGQFLIDLEDRTVTLERHQGITVPKGVMHRPRAPLRTVVLMVETDTIVPTGDSNA